MKRSLKLIGVGASAGGLDALIDFFKKVPGNCDSAFLVIQHLSPDHDSVLNELLAPHAKLPVVEAVDGMQLEGGAIYLCPPGVIARVNQLVLDFEMRPKGKSIVLPINILFESMGETLAPACAVVVLSGTGSDGSRGIQSVARSGGIVAVQSPETADFTGMPQSAISTDKCHIIAPPEKLWSKIGGYDDGVESKSASEEPHSTPGKEPSPSESGDYAEIFSYLEGRFGLDFSLYQINSVTRRLSRRMELSAVPDSKAYLRYLKKNDSEAKCLYQDLLIGVTEFFRDVESFEFLSQKAIKSAMTAERDQDFRIWSAGCATGQEPYSLYMIADEVKREVGFTGKITVFATDVFNPSIDVAGKGIYRADGLVGISADRKERYFQEVDAEHYKIQSHVRKNIVFAQHNFLTDAPFTNMDIVSCRNALIYLKTNSQEVALGAFAYSLRDSGFLFLGASESLGKLDSSFNVVSEKAKIFQKHSNPLKPKRWPEMLAHSKKVKQLDTRIAGASVTINRDLLNAYDSLLERFAPCGFLVNTNLEVLHYFGDVAKYCVNVSGRVTLDFAEQLEKRLRLAVTALLHLTERKNERAVSTGISCKSRRGPCLVDVAVEPLRDSHGEIRNFLIEIYGRKTQNLTQVPVAEESPAEGQGAEPTVEQVELLEDELKSTRENLEAANEELQVSNEELRAMNEELQSTNGELTTLNAEYEGKNSELVDVNTSYENLLQSTEDGVLYVDKAMHVQRYNLAIRIAFPLIPNDLGRPLQDIACDMEGANTILDDVRSVLATGERLEREVPTNGRFFMQRIIPCLLEGDILDGALLTFTDVTEARRMGRRFKFALQTARLSWWDWELVGDILEVTSGGACLLGEDCLSVSRGRNGWMELVHPDDRAQVRCSLDDCLEGRTAEWACEHRFRTSSDEWLWVYNQGIVTRRDEKGNPLEMMGTTKDVNSYKQAQDDLQVSRLKAEETNRAKSDFLAVMSHELRTPLNPILGFADMLIDEVQNEEQKEILNTIVESGNHMLALVDEILEYGKLDAAKTKLESSEFSLTDFVQNKVHLMSGLIKDAPINLHSSIDWGPVEESRSPVLIGDVGMIRQICRNLISNAIKFTKQGSVDFDVSVQEVEGEQAIVRFDVKDSGIGIAEEDISKLFTPFTQVQSGTTREYGGTGLGLAICKRLVELMDGSISVKSKEDKGSTFTVMLPLLLRYSEASTKSIEEPGRPRAASTEMILSGNVLLVEDNKSNAYYIKTLIDLRTARAEIAFDGESALEQLSKRSFDLVFLDLHMPGIGGLETLKRIRSSENSRLKKLPIFILTADASVEAKEDSEKHSADGLLVKPVRPPELYKVLDKYLKRG